MDPLTLGIAAVGIGMQVFGGMSASEHANQANQVQQQIAGLEQGVNGQRRDAMELSGRRQQMEVFRNNQRQRAMATNAAVNQGAQFGSGLQGGLAQVQDQSMFNSLGISQNLQIGRNIFGLNDQITGAKAQVSSIQTQMGQDQGIASLGGSISRSAGTLGQMGQGFGSGGGGGLAAGNAFNNSNMNSQYYGPLN